MIQALADLRAELAGSAWLGLLVDAAGKATFLLLAAAVATWLTRRSSASARHVVWTLAIAGALLLPVLSLVLPSWRLQILPARPALAEPAHGLRADTPSTLPGPQGMLVTVADSAPHELHTGPSTSSGRTASGSGVMGSGSGRTGWAEKLALIWVAGVLVSLLRILSGRIGVWRLGKRAREMQKHAWATLVRALALELGVRRPVRLLRADCGALPMTWGIRRPVVLLPPEADAWSRDRLEMVLRHELAHVQRLDAFTQFLAQVACAVYWFHPLVWIAERRMRALREYACDDRVLAAGNRPSEYAGEILEIVRSVQRHDRLASATLAMARPNQLEGRLVAILDPCLPRRGFGRLAKGVLATAFVTLVLPLAMFQPAAAAQTAPRKGVLPRLSAEESARRNAQVTVTPDVAPQPSPAPAPATGAVCNPGKRSRATISHSESDGSKSWRAVREGSGCRLELQSRGTIRLQAESGSVQLTPGASLVATEQANGAERELTLKADPAGHLTTSWIVAGVERPLGLDSRQFLRTMVEAMPAFRGSDLIVSRNSAPTAPTPPTAPIPPAAPSPPTPPTAPAPPAAPAPSCLVVAAPDVRPESAGLPMDARHAKMLQEVREDEAEASAEIEQAERESRSDSDLLERLERIAGDHHLAGEKARAAFIKAAMRLRSADAKGEALRTLLAEAPITVDTGRAILRAAATISSDDEKLDVLEYMHKIREHMLFHGPLADDFVQTASTFHSDEDTAEALFQTLHPYEVPRDAVVHALILTRDRIRSDDARQRVLVEVKDHHLNPQDPEIEQLYRAVVDKMGRDAREEALENLRDAHTSSDAVPRKELIVIGEVPRAQALAEVARARAQARAELERFRAEKDRLREERQREKDEAQRMKDEVRRAKDEAKRIKVELRRIAEDARARAHDIQLKLEDVDIDTEVDEALREINEELLEIDESLEDR